MEKEIEFKDIRVGDTIRREFTFSDVAGTHSAVVASIDGESAITAKSEHIASLFWRNSTYILVNRPKPPLPTEPGALIKVTKLDGQSGEWLARLGDDGWWGLLNLRRKDHRVWAYPEGIQEFRHIEIFEVTP